MTKIETTEILEKLTSNIVYTTQKENTQISSLIVDTYLPYNESTFVSLLGFSDLKKFSNYFSFYIYFVTLKNKIYSKILIFPIIIDYYRNRRNLKQVEAKCNLNNIISSNNYKYLCEIHEDITKIKSISITPDFKFISQNDIKLIGISPFANLYINNLQSIDEKYNTLLNKNIYILDNSTFSGIDILAFNISGVIEGTQPKLENKNITVNTNLKDQKSKEEIDCIIHNLTLNNYLLNCKANKSLNLDLQSAISFINSDDILLLNFYNTSDLIIKNKEQNNIYSKRFFKNQKGGISSGLIIAIIIILIVVLVSAIFASYYLRRKNLKIENRVENSSIKNLKMI